MSSIADLKVAVDYLAGPTALDGIDELQIKEVRRLEAQHGLLSQQLYEQITLLAGDALRAAEAALAQRT